MESSDIYKQFLTLHNLIQKVIEAQGTIVSAVNLLDERIDEEKRSIHIRVTQNDEYLESQLNKIKEDLQDLHGQVANVTPMKKVSER
jgi:hypothetical protein